MKNIDEIKKLNEELEIREMFILKAENERLKRENQIITGMHNSSNNRFNKLYSILQEIKEYLKDIDYIAQFDGTPYDLSVEIKQIITKAEEE